jgi:hypothetical protein
MIGAAFYANYVKLGVEKLWETCGQIARHAIGYCLHVVHKSLLESANSDFAGGPLRCKDAVTFCFSALETQHVPTAVEGPERIERVLEKLAIQKEIEQIGKECPS